MGLFSASSGYNREDLKIALEAMSGVVGWWNTDHCDLYGFKIKLWAGSVEECCQKGSWLFDENPFYFAQPPGPFKRIAAFLVLGCLYPFISFEQNGIPPMKRDGFPCNDYEKRVWRVRLLLQALPHLFARLKLRVNGSWDHVSWQGFPSAHYELEFMNWLKWLDPMDELEEVVSKVMDWRLFQKKRIARMTMATALSIEASCYASAQTNCHPILGQTEACLKKLSAEQIEDLSFDFLPGN